MTGFEMLIGAGLISILCMISKQLGGIKAELTHIVEAMDDHELRLRAVERRRQAKRNVGPRA